MLFVWATVGTHLVASVFKSLKIFYGPFETGDNRSMTGAVEVAYSTTCLRSMPQKFATGPRHPNYAMDRDAPATILNFTVGRLYLRTLLSLR